MIRIALAAVVLATAPALCLAGENDSDRERLLQGIDVLDRPGVPGNLVVFGDDAFAVLTGGKRPEPVIAAAHHGSGRVVAMAHSGYLDASTLPLQNDSRGKLLRNVLSWTTGGEEGASIRIIGRDEHLAAALREAGFSAEHGGAPAADEQIDLVIWRNGAGDADTADAVTEYVGRGGSLITAACPWGWAQLRAKKRLTVRDDMPENHALRRMGLVFADGTVDATRGGRYAVALSRPDHAHAGRALAGLVAAAKGAAQRSYLVERALRALPADDDTFLPAVEKAIERVPDDRVPRPGAPLGKRDGLARLAVTVQSLRWRNSVVTDVAAAPGADAFPGAVAADAPRIVRTLTLDPTIAGWQSTGLYLAPGDVLTMCEVNITLYAPGGTGWRLRIGCHTDKLWHKDGWERWPEITHVRHVKPATRHTVATPWGGPIYFEATDRAQPITIEIGGVVEAPHFVLGDAESEESWKTRRLAPGPWAEIEGRNMVLSVPSAAVRELDDPKRVAEFWDAVLASHCDLAATPLPKRRERFVPDVQISAGYMHSGYPIMMHLDTVTAPAEGGLVPLLDVDARTTTSSWGYFHELGHNRQRGWWTFRGTTEVTCNLFSLYTHETLCGVEPWENPWLAAQKKKAQPYLAAGADFAQWRRQPGLALIVYAQIQREFGWEPFTTVFRDYEEGPADARPRDDQAKIDQFVVRLSKAAKHDLRPLWKRWGAPLSEWVMKDPELAQLPAWMPDFDDLD